MARFGEGLGAQFAAGVLTRDLSVQRQRLLDHPLWTGIATGDTTAAHLACFAVQDAWLIQQIAWLDGSMIARAPGSAVADLLIQKLLPKSGATEVLVAFGEAFGATRAEVEAPVPLAGCAALTSLFVYQIARGSFLEAYATLAASETIFLEICGRIEGPLSQRFTLSPAAMAFVSGHDGLVEVERAGDRLLTELVQTAEDRQRVTGALSLLYDTEALFYDTVLASA